MYAQKYIFLVYSLYALSHLTSCENDLDMYMYVMGYQFPHLRNDFTDLSYFDGYEVRLYVYNTMCRMDNVMF